MHVPLMTRAFRLKAFVANFNSPAHTRTDRGHILGFKAEFMLSNPTSDQAPKTLAAIKRKLEAMAFHKGVVAACEFALEEFRQTRASARSILYYKDSVKNYQDAMLTFIVGQKDNLATLDTRVQLDKAFNLLSDIKDVLETYPLGDGKSEHSKTKTTVMLLINQVEGRLDSMQDAEVLSIFTGKTVALDRLPQSERPEFLIPKGNVPPRLVT